MCRAPCPQACIPLKPAQLRGESGTTARVSAAADCHHVTSQTPFLHMHRFRERRACSAMAHKHSLDTALADIVDRIESGPVSMDVAYGSHKVHDAATLTPDQVGARCPTAISSSCGIQHSVPAWLAAHARTSHWPAAFATSLHSCTELWRMHRTKRTNCCRRRSSRALGCTAPIPTCFTL